jgi:hypothetical protein
MSPAYYDCHLYWLENLGIAYRQAATGIDRERLARAGPFTGHRVADGRIYAVTRSGVGFVAARPQFEQLAREFGDL